MRYATRYNHRDANEPVIIAALKKLAIPYWQAGPLDLWIWMGEYIPVEIKTAKGKLTAGQKAFISECAMQKRPYFVWRGVDEMLNSLENRHAQ